MDWKKIAPWNWFKDEQAKAPAVAVGSPAELHPADAFSTLLAEMQRLFHDLAERPNVGPLRSLPLRPRVDIAEGAKSYTVSAELPGVDLDDVAIEVDDGRLLIRAEKRRESETEDEGYHCVERSYGSVQRMLSLPDDADADSIDARFKNGVLTLDIPKRAEAAPPGRRIEVQRG